MRFKLVNAVALSALLPLAASAVPRRQPLRILTPGHTAATKQALPVIPALKYYGGLVLSNVKAVPVFWGQPDPKLQQSLESFFADLVASPYVDLLAQYSVNGQTIGRGTVAPSAIIHPSVTATTIAQSDISNELAAQIGAGNVPAPDDNTVFFVFLAPGITEADGSDVSCQTYCGYHDVTIVNALKLRYAVLPDFTASGCANGCGPSGFAGLTDTVSHELAEAITDPDPSDPLDVSTAWYDAAQGDALSDHAEIGDACAGGGDNVALQGASGLTWQVQRLWSNADKACTATSAGSARLAFANPQLHATAQGNVSLALQSSGPSTQLLVPRAVVAPLNVDAAFDELQFYAGSGTHLTLGLGFPIPPHVSLVVAAASGDSMPFAQLDITADDFALVDAPAQSMRAGQSTTVTIATKGVNGATPDITFGLQSPPAGVTATFNPPTVPAGQSTTATLAAAPGVGTANLAIYVEGHTALVSRSAVVPATVAGDDYTLALSANSLELAQGGTVTVDVTVTFTSGSPQPVALSAPGLPLGVSATFQPATLQPGGSAQVTFQAAPSLAQVPLPLTVRASTPYQSQDATLTAKVVPAPGCTSAGATPLALFGLALLLRRRG